MIKEEKSAGVIVVLKGEENKFLILFQDKKLMNWSFPKGRIEERESTIEAALRELKEETGITDIEILDFPPIEEYYTFEIKDQEYHKSIMYFVGIVKDDKVKMQESEIYDYKWATYDEAFETFDFAKESRRQVLKHAKEYLDMLK